MSERPEQEEQGEQEEHSKTLLLTGAGGRLGGQLGQYLYQRGYRVRALVRNANSLPNYFERTLEWSVAKDNPVALRELLERVEGIIHLASSSSKDPTASYDAQLVMPKLLLDTAPPSVSHFIFTSSIKAVSGEMCTTPISSTTAPLPESDYGQLKLKAEALVQDHIVSSRIASFSLRLPMVYGAGPAGNFNLLRKAARWNLPLPVAADNKRSVLYSENLFACIENLLSQPMRPGYQLLHLADGDGISTRAFFQLIAETQNRRGLCITLPEQWAQTLRRVPLVGGIAARLLGSLQFDRSELNALPGWQMPFSTADGVKASSSIDCT